MINLPLRSERPPRVRVMVADSFGNRGSGATQDGGAGPWVNLPMLSAVRAGVELMDGMTRAALPEIGECQLRMRFGVIDGKVIGLSAEAVASVQASGSWDPDEDLLAVPSLVGKEIRVQFAPDDGSAPAWRTEWWGRCEYEQDSEWPAGIIPVGERIYTCFDGLFRTKRWFMTSHGAYVNGSTYKPAPGHPGYNIGLAGKTLGNRESTGANYQPFPDSDLKLFYHTWQGTGQTTVWTDLQAAEHALRVSRPTGEPLFSFAGTTELLTTGATPWPVQETDSAFDLLTMICARERGRGSVFVDWDDDTLDNTGPLKVKLSVMPQTYAAITYTDNPNTGHTATIPGALAKGTGVAVDLIGDHRAMPQGFNRSVRGLTRYDAVETVGECIQVLITGSRYDGTISLDNRWSADDATAFLALDATERIDEVWRPVYQAYGIPRAWQGLAEDHNGGGEVAQHRVDYRCNDAGAVIVPTGSVDTSPLMVKVLPDTPLLEGYTYVDSTPFRRDAAAEVGGPDRRPPAVWLRTADDRYLSGDDAGLCVHVKGDAIMIARSADQATGIRVVSDTDEDDLEAVYDTNQIGITIGLELPHRLRFKTIRPDLPTGLGVKNVKRVEVPDAHLWLASPGAMWDIDSTAANSDGSPGRREACDGTTSAPGVLRDDRERVAVMHALACAWYLQEHRPASWTLRACGMLPDFGIVSDVGASQIDPDDTVDYPQLGQLVTTLAANGQVVTINAPITGIIYNHQSQTTTWSCDWQDLDVRRA